MLDLGRPLDVVALGSRGTSQPAAGPVWARSAVRRWLRLDIWSRLDVGPIRAERRQPPGRPSERPLPGDTAAGRVPAAFPIRAIRCQPAPSASCSGTGSGRRPASILFRARQALRPEGRIGCRACRDPAVLREEGPTLGKALHEPVLLTVSRPNRNGTQPAHGRAHRPDFVMAELCHVSKASRCEHPWRVVKEADIGRPRKCAFQVTCVHPR